MLNSKQRSVWGVLVVMSALLNINSIVFSHEFDSILYYNRAFIVFIAALVLIRINTCHSYYQSVICVLTLCLFGLLEYDLTTYENIVYSKYEDYVHGVMAIRIVGFILGFYEQIWFTGGDNSTDSNNSFSCFSQGKIK